MTTPSLRLKVTDFLATDFEKEVFQELMKLKQMDYLSGVSFPLYFWYDRETEVVDLSTLEPFIKRRVNKPILYTFIGHTIVDTFYIYKSKSLLLHHLLAIYVSLKARYNIYYSNIIYAAYISEIYPFIGALISVSNAKTSVSGRSFFKPTA